MSTPNELDNAQGVFDRVYAAFHKLAPSRKDVEIFYADATATLKSNPQDLAGAYALLLLSGSVIPFDHEHMPVVAERCREYALVNRHVMYRFGLYHLSREENDAAHEMASQYLETDPGEPLAHEIIARALHYSADRDTVLRHFQRIAAEARTGIRYQNQVPLTWSEVSRSRGTFKIPRKNRTLLHREIVKAGQLRLSSFHDLMRERTIVWQPSLLNDETVILKGAIVSKKAPAAAHFDVRSDDETWTFAAERISSERCGQSAALSAHVTIWRAEAAELPADTPFKIELSAPDYEALQTGALSDFVIASAKSAGAETLAPIPVGNDQLSFNGIGRAQTPGTKLIFRYGAAPDALDQSIEAGVLPPGVNAIVKEDMANESQRLFNFGFYADLERSDDPALSDDEVKLSQVVLSPFGQDAHHMNGSGFIALVFSWKSIAHVDPALPAPYRAPLAARNVDFLKLDLRDAAMSVRLKGNGITSSDYFPLCWMTSGSGMPCDFGDMVEFSTPWLKTGDAGDHMFTGGGAWQTFTYRLSTNTNDWSFSGNNVEELGNTMARYAYTPLGACLEDGRGGNLLFGFGLGEPTASPQGEVRIGGLELCYRSYSLLAPGQSGQLASSPPGSFLDPGFLTDGVCGDKGRMWCSRQAPEAPQSFEWFLRTLCTIDAIRFTQNLMFPAKDIIVEISEGGEAYEPLWRGELAKDGSSAAGTINAGKDGPAFPATPVTCIVFDDPKRAQFVKLTIASGHGTTWGLDQFEVFSSEALSLPDGEPVSMSVDVDGFSPGDDVYVQAAIVDGASETRGDVRHCRVPETDKPIIASVEEIKGDEGYLHLLVHVNAMGHFTKVGAEVNGTEVSANIKDIGRQPTFRHATFLVDRDAMPKNADLVVYAASDAGRTEMTFRGEF